MGTRIVIQTDGAAFLYEDPPKLRTDGMEYPYLVLSSSQVKDYRVPFLTRVTDYVKANPLKVQAVLALVLGNAPAPLVAAIKAVLL